MVSKPPAADARLAAIVASSDDAIVSKDLSGYITSWNKAAERMFGYTAAEAVGQHITIIIPQERHSEEDFVLGEVGAGKVVDHYETVRQRKDGRRIEISLTASPVLAPDGSVIGVSKIARDITESRRAEREAWRLAAIVESSDDAIVSKDLNGVVKTWNRGAEAIFGYTAEEMIGKSITVIIPRERLAEEETVLRQIRAGQTVGHFETVRQTKDGRLVPVSLTVSPIRSSDGTIIGASKIARDVTEQHRLREAAEEASRHKDEFLAVLSHELRTPLNTVVGYIKILRRDANVSQALREKALDALERNADLLTRLVNDVLDTSRIVTGKLRLSLAAVSLPAIITEAIETVRPAIEAKHIRLDVDLPDELEMIGDGDRLRQVIWNLVSNAAKFTPAGGHVAVRASTHESGARIVVADSGAGIAADHLALVFQRFWQADSGLAREQPGLGLGLALSLHIVELHGGTIAVTSEGQDKGATFTIDLPRVAVRDVMDSRLSRETPPPTRRVPDSAAGGP